MKQKITVQLLIKNNESTIEKTLNSVQALNADILAFNIGCDDNSIEICRKYNVKVYDSPNKKIDASKLRNQLIDISKSKWQLFIEPWEIITDYTKIESLLGNENNAYFFNIMQNDMCTFEARLWHKDMNLKFRQPVFEYLNIKDTALKKNDCIIYSLGQKRVSLEQIQEWRKIAPANIEPLYYEAFYYLSIRDWDKFISKASHYLFANKLVNKSSIMIRYYLAIVLFSVKKDAKESLRHILSCITNKPLMAEFWCVLGDIYYHLIGEYKKAKQFYLNAVTLGKHRLYEDMWPMEISKYKIYPFEMIKSCDNMINETKMVGVKMKRN